MINIYCDESCHLEHDKQKVMAIGGIACPKYAKFNVYKDIKKIKEKHLIMPYQEISKRIAMKNDFEFIGESDGCSVFKRKLVNKI